MSTQGIVSVKFFLESNCTLVGWDQTWASKQFLRNVLLCVLKEVAKHQVAGVAFADEIKYTVSVIKSSRQKFGHTF